MREKWEEWLATDEEGYTRYGNRKSASYRMVTEWVNECWGAIPKPLIVRSFIENGLKLYGGDLKVLHRKLRDCVERNVLPDDDSISGEESDESESDTDTGADNEDSGTDTSYTDINSISITIK